MSEADLKNLHVLVVDDDPTTQHLVSMVLKMAGAQVTVATNAVEAVGALRTAPRVVDVVLCDYNMPCGNGLQLLSTIRTGQIQNVRPDICFVMITSDSQVETIQLASRLDVNGYLLKPVTSAKLKDSIAKARKKYFPVDFARYELVTVPITP